jgi:hypothetical protein
VSQCHVSDGFGDPARHSYDFEELRGAKSDSISAEHFTPPHLQHHSFFTSDHPELISSSPGLQSNGEKTVVVVLVMVLVVVVVNVEVHVLVLVGVVVEVVDVEDIVVEVFVQVLVLVVEVVAVVVVVQPKFSWRQHHSCFASLHAVCQDATPTWQEYR